jgi:hypothetical protein
MSEPSSASKKAALGIAQRFDKNFDYTKEYALQSLAEIVQAASDANNAELIRANENLFRIKQKALVENIDLNELSKWKKSDQEVGALQQEWQTWYFDEYGNIRCHDGTSVCTLADLKANSGYATRRLIEKHNASLGVLQADTERLDWLERNSFGGYGFAMRSIEFPKMKLREAIDAARGLSK